MAPMLLVARAANSRSAVIAHRKSETAQFRRLFSWWKSAAVGQHDEGNGTPLEFRQQIGGAGQDVILTERSEEPGTRNATAIDATPNDDMIQLMCRWSKPRTRMRYSGANVKNTSK